MPEIRNTEFQVVTLGAVKPDGTPDIATVLFRFPVPYQQMTVRQAVKVDEIDVPGRSGAVKQATGYDDTEVSIAISLVDEEDNSGTVTRSALEQFTTLQLAFRDRSDPVGEGSGSSAGRYAVPTVFSIQSPLTDACGIRTVLFRGIDVNDTPGETSLELTLSFVEFEPVARQVEKRRQEAVRKSQAAAEAKTAAESAAVAAHDQAVGTEDPLAAAFRQGKADAMGGAP